MNKTYFIVLPDPSGKKYTTEAAALDAATELVRAGAVPKGTAVVFKALVEVHQDPTPPIVRKHLEEP